MAGAWQFVLDNAGRRPRDARARSAPETSRAGATSPRERIPPSRPPPPSPPPPPLPPPPLPRAPPPPPPLLSPDAPTPPLPPRHPLTRHLSLFRPPHPRRPPQLPSPRHLTLSPHKPHHLYSVPPLTPSLPVDSPLFPRPPPPSPPSPRLPPSPPPLSHLFVPYSPSPPPPPHPPSPHPLLSIPLPALLVSPAAANPSPFLTPLPRAPSSFPTPRLWPSHPPSISLLAEHYSPKIMGQTGTHPLPPSDSARAPGTVRRSPPPPDFLEVPLEGKAVPRKGAVDCPRVMVVRRLSSPYGDEISTPTKASPHHNLTGKNSEESLRRVPRPTAQQVSDPSSNEADRPFSATCV